MELDKTDKKILNTLKQNSRASLTQIAKAARIKKETAAYRLKRILKQGLITNFHVVLNPQLMGLQHAVVYVQLIHSTAEKEQEFLQFLKKLGIPWISVLVGKWNFTFDVYTPSSQEFTDTLQKILQTYGSIIGDYSVATVERTWYSYEQWIKKKGAKHKNRATLDDVDWRIVALLSKNARLSYVEVAKHIPLTPNGIKDRIRNLEKAGIIQGYTIIPNYRTLGYEGYGLQVKLRNYETKTVRKIFAFLQGDPRVIILYQYTSGQWNFDIRVSVKHSAEFRTFILLLNEKFPGMLNIVDFYLVLEEAKF